MPYDPRRGADQPGLVREGMLDRLLRKLIRPRVEYPLAQVPISQGGDLENRWAPLRVKYATYEANTHELKVIVIGGRVALPGGATDIADHIVLIPFPSTNSTYWIYLDADFGVLDYNPTFPPPPGNIEVATVTTPSAWPATTVYNTHRPQPDFDSLHTLKPVAGDAVIVLSDRTTYSWSGTAWNVLLTVVDKRPWFTAPRVGTGASASFVGEVHIPIFMDGANGYTALAGPGDQPIEQALFRWDELSWQATGIDWWFEAIVTQHALSDPTDYLTVKLLDLTGSVEIASVASTGPVFTERQSVPVSMPFSCEMGIAVNNASTTQTAKLWAARLIAKYF